MPPDEKGSITRWYTHAATQADVDGDGHLDLVMGNFFRENSDVLNPDGTGVAMVLHAGKSHALNGGGAKLFKDLSQSRIEMLNIGSNSFSRHGRRFSAYFLYNEL